MPPGVIGECINYRASADCLLTTPRGAVLCRETVTEIAVIERSSPNVEEFRITRPGRYKDAEGSVVYIVHALDGDDQYPWQKAGYGRSTAECWTDTGLYKIGGTGPFDIVEGPLVDEAEEGAGLKGKYALNGSRLSRVDTEDELKRLLHNGARVFDLSKLPASAIVEPEPEPEPERERRKVWIAIKQDGWVEAFKFKPAHRMHDWVAFVETEIDFAHGEGLSDG
jgi:hypothetical protein